MQQRSCIGNSELSWFTVLQTRKFQHPACMMTSILGGPGQSSKQPLKCVQVVVAVLLFFFVGELLFQNKQLTFDTTTLTSCSQNPLTGLPRGDQAASIPILANSPTLHEAFGPDIVVHWDDLTELAPKGLRTSIDTSDGDAVRFMRYGMSPVKNVCIRPNGTIVVVGLSESELALGLAAAGEAMVKVWKEAYDCSWGCNGVAHEKEVPENALWVAGNTTHIIPYLGNVFHHFAERVWPLLTGFRDPLDKDRRRGGQTAYYYVHRMHTWLDQAHHSMDRNTFMFQIALLSRLAPPGTRPRFLQHGEDETRPLCFESLMLSSATSGRMSPKLGSANFAPGVARYRHAAFDHFRVASPEVSLPPHPLRVTLYGRGDASRRRATNIAEVAHHLRTSVQPPLIVTVVDELLERGLYSQSLAEVVSLMAQTDVYITPHGANTWATIFMPERSAVIEIYGPCGPGTWISNTIVPALGLKHRTEGNPWGERVASPRAGNTTECRSAGETPDFTIDMEKLRAEIQSLRAVDGPGDRLPLHWLFDWRRKSYVWQD